MHWFTSFLVYVIVWWLTLFAVLPLGVQPDTEGDPAAGGWRGAPKAPGIGRKVLITFGVATLIWGGIMLLVTSEYLSFRSGILAMPEN